MAVAQILQGLFVTRYVLQFLLYCLNLNYLLQFLIHPLLYTNSLLLLYEEEIPTEAQ